MLISSLVGWWYFDGWLGQVDRVRTMFQRVADKFSIGLLIRTLFAPFRQIAADEQARGDSFFAVLTDKLVSRAIGFLMRTVMIVAGCVSLVLLAVVSLVRLLIWPLLPIMPLVGLILMLIVGVPWTIG